MADMQNQGILDRQVYVDDRYIPFGELTPEDARILAAQFSGLSGGGLEAKVAPVGRAWRELAELMTESGAPRGAAGGPERAAARAAGRRVGAAGGGWLSS